MKLICQKLQKSIELIKQLLLCAFQKHDNEKPVSEYINKHKMNILEECINSAIIIDDKRDEVEKLVQLLKSLGIYVEYHNYAGDLHVDGEGHLKNRNLIFMDLMLNDNSSQIRENISIVITLLGRITNGESFGLYGLVVWTKHHEHVEELKEALSKASVSLAVSEDTDEEEAVVDFHLDNPPLFVIGLSKSKYNLGNGGYNYDSLKDDLEKALSDNKSAYFFVQWNATVERAKKHVVRDFYTLGKDYTVRDQRLTYLLCELAKNHTGLHDATDYPYLTTDAYKAFDELLFSKLYVEQKDISTPLFDTDLNCPFDKVEEKQRIAAILNAMFFIDDITGRTHQNAFACKSFDKYSSSQPAFILFKLRLPLVVLSFFRIESAIFVIVEKFLAAFFTFLLSSSLKVKSSCQCKLFSIPQCALIEFAIFSGFSLPKELI